MKRNLLDITQKISRKRNRAVLNPKNLMDSTYYVFEAINWKIPDILREIEYAETQDRLLVYINNLLISPIDYIVEISPNGLLIKFIKNNFGYSLDEKDFIEIVGNIEKYA